MHTACPSRCTEQSLPHSGTASMVCSAVLHACSTAHAAGSHGLLCTEAQCQSLLNMLEFSNLVAGEGTLSSLAVLILSFSLCTRLPSGASVVRSLCVKVLSWPFNSRQTSHGCTAYLDSDRAAMDRQQPRTEVSTRRFFTCSLPFLRSSLRRLTPSAEGGQAVAKQMAAIALLLPTVTGRRLRGLRYKTVQLRICMPAPFGPTKPDRPGPSPVILQLS